MTARVHSRLVLRTLGRLSEWAGGLTARFFLLVSVPQNDSDSIPTARDQLESTSVESPPLSPALSCPGVLGRIRRIPACTETP